MMAYPHLTHLFIAILYFIENQVDVGIFTKVLIMSLWQDFKELGYGNISNEYYLFATKSLETFFRIIFWE